MGQCCPEDRVALAMGGGVSCEHHGGPPCFGTKGKNRKEKEGQGGGDQQGVQIQVSVFSHVFCTLDLVFFSHLCGNFNNYNCMAHYIDRYSPTHNVALWAVTQCITILREQTICIG